MSTLNEECVSCCDLRVLSACNLNSPFTTSVLRVFVNAHRSQKHRQEGAHSHPHAQMSCYFFRTPLSLSCALASPRIPCRCHSLLHHTQKELVHSRLSRLFRLRLQRLLLVRSRAHPSHQRVIVDRVMNPRSADPPVVPDRVTSLRRLRPSVLSFPSARHGSHVSPSEIRYRPLASGGNCDRGRVF